MPSSLIPVQYQWVLNMPNQTKLIAEALKLVGIKEMPGKDKNSPQIMAMAADLGIADIYLNDEMAWCALAMSWLCWKCDKRLPGIKYDLIRAKSFEDWGDESIVPMYGDVVVYKRGTGSERHVGILIGEDIETHHILGGNQSNSYGFTRMAKSRLVTARRCYKNGQPASVRQYTLAPSGLISRNEA